MTSAAFIASWASLGILVGAALAAYALRQLSSAPSGLWVPGISAALLTSCAFGGVAWRFGGQFDLLPYSTVAAIGVTLGLIDIVEQRLPNVLVYPAIVIVAVLVTISAIANSRELDLLRALAGMMTLAGFYLVLALVSRGGLGAGDVKLGGLLGFTLGWLSWSSLIAATFLAWFVAVLVWLILRATRRTTRDSLLPMGPFLVLGALLAIITPPV